MIIYYWKSKDGKWIKTVKYAQCEYVFWDRTCCQGIYGHTHEHWAYAPCGALNVTIGMENEAHIPVGHKKWIHPKSKRYQRYTKFAIIETIVTDKKVVAKLNKGHAPEREAYIAQ